jgi:uncharacterized repeat protein (TIGR03803 family)
MPPGICGALRKRANPNGLISDSHGNLFWTSVAGGTDNPGTIFEISPAGNGTWQEQVLYSLQPVWMGRLHGRA